MGFLADVVRWFTTASHWQGEAGVVHRLAEHVAMSGVSVTAAAALALPVGIWLGHLRRAGAVAVNVSNVGRAIPSFAILVLAAEVVGIGWRPAFVALVALGVPPMLTNAYVGMAEVDADVRESAREWG
jgi:osmoprotectant transport system permease protein